MAIYRKRGSCRMKIVVAVGITAFTLFVLQYLYFTPDRSRRLHEEHLHLKLSEIREDDARSRMNVAAETGNQSHREVKTVLMHSFPYWYELKSGNGVFSTCQYPCTLTLDVGLQDQADSVVIYSHGIHVLESPHRLIKQVWVFFAVECPVNAQNSLFQRSKWNSVFNWTMTYRRDSDFYFGYGDVVKAHPELPTRNVSSVVSGKSKLVAWFVSNCHTQSKRSEFVDVLKDFIQVDVYGGCGPLRCERDKDNACLEMLSKDYFFYLSFENAICNDYLSEKVYRIMKLTDVVPVVRGGANYSSLLPHHSFIDASQFPTVKALADHLKQVAGDRKVYESYLAWKREWRVIEPIPFSFCEFCERLHNRDRWTRVYSDIHSWWTNGQCHNPPAVIRS